MNICVKQLENYWDKIFASPIKVMDGNEEKTIIPRRTNNLSEQFYRKIKYLLRWLSGRPTVSKDIYYTLNGLNLNFNRFLITDCQFIFKFSNLIINQLKYNQHLKFFPD